MGKSLLENLSLPQAFSSIGRFSCRGARSPPGRSCRHPPSKRSKSPDTQTAPPICPIRICSNVFGTVRWMFCCPLRSIRLSLCLSLVPVSTALWLTARSPPMSTPITGKKHGLSKLCDSSGNRSADTDLLERKLYTFFREKRGRSNCRGLCRGGSPGFESLLKWKLGRRRFLFCPVFLPFQFLIL